MLSSLPVVCILFCFLLYFSPSKAKAIDLLDFSSLEPIIPNYCNNSDALKTIGLIKATLGQFLGYECSPEFYHCRWQSDGFLTYRKQCKAGLVYDVLGTQNCNYDYNVNSCGIRGKGATRCNRTDFYCPLSEQCLSMAKRCDGFYDCTLEEDEQNCPLCAAGQFSCVVSEQCVALDRRCNGIEDCADGTDERNCDICGNGLFHCAKSDECVPINERCDGKRQCPHGEDEMLCKSQKFMCQSRDANIAINQVCDGIPQCLDGSDEIYCDVTAGGRSISFSSIPNNIPLPSWNRKVNEEDGYDYEGITSNDRPKFPMLTLDRLNTKMKKISSPVLQPTSQLWVSPSNLLSNMPSTTTTQKMTFVKPKRRTDAIQKENLIRYPTKSLANLEERTTVKTQKVKQVIITQTTPSVIENTYREDEVKSSILGKLSSRIQGKMTPELMAKIERLILEELPMMQPRKSTVSRMDNPSPTIRI